MTGSRALIQLSIVKGESKTPITGLDRPLRLQEDEAPRIFRKSANEGGKIVSPTHHPSVPQGG